MKVKCGEERPACVRCSRANRECPGYPPRIHNFRYTQRASSGRLIWTVEQHNTICPTKATQSGPSEAIEDSSLAGHGAAAALKARLQQHHTRLPPSVSTEWEPYALSYFFYFHTIPWESDTFFGGYMSSLETFCQDASRRSYLDHALRATALVSISHKTDSKWPLLKAMTYRSEALIALFRVLSDQTEAGTDEALTALFLLDRLDASGSPFPFIEGHSLTT